MKKDKTLHIRLSEEERELVQAGADARNRSVASYLLQLAREDSKRNAQLKGKRTMHKLEWGKQLTDEEASGLEELADALTKATKPYYERINAAHIAHVEEDWITREAYEAYVEKQMPEIKKYENAASVITDYVAWVDMKMAGISLGNPHTEAELREALVLANKCYAYQNNIYPEI